MKRPTYVPKEEARLAWRVPAFAKAVGVSRDTVYRWARTGEIASVNFGGTVLIPASEATRLLNESPGEGAP